MTDETRDSKLYELAERVFDVFNEFMCERNRVIGTDNPMTYISDEDGQTLIYTRGEYAEDLIDGINKLHGFDPLKHRAFKTAIQLASTTDLIQELEQRNGVESVLIGCDDGPAKTIVIHNLSNLDSIIVKHPSVNLQDCENRNCPLLDGIICMATNNDSCPPRKDE